MLALGDPNSVAAPSAYELKRSPYSSHSQLLQFLPPEGRGERVLDVGCAGGYLAEVLTDRGYEVTGVDRPGTASGSFPKTAQFIPTDLDSGLPPLSGVFDFILCADVLEHLREPQKLLRELRPSLAPAGRLLASLPNSANLYFRLNVLIGKFPQHDRGLFDRTHLHFYTWTTWVELFSQSGFMIESVQPTGVPVGLAMPRWEGSGPVRALELAAFWMARVWKKLFAYQFVIAARPKVGS